jgi:DNA-binding CsgD family transcriptional regulator
MKNKQRFIEWLSFHPTPDDIARVLVTDYLSDLGVRCMRFGRVNNDDSATALGQNGYPDADLWRNVVVPGSEWRSWDLPEIDIIVGKNISQWSPDSKLCVINLRDRGVIQGSAVFEFANEVVDNRKNQIVESLEVFCSGISLYLSFQNHPRQGPAILAGGSIDSREAATTQFTQRQIQVLRGMVEGRTNHELANELGFSVSTNRHETMRIYQGLGVSDRKEAAQKALALNLIQVAAKI